MPDFHAFLTQKYPLYSDKDMKVNLTVGQVCEMVGEYIMIEIDNLTYEDLARFDEGLNDIAEGKATSWDEVKVVDKVELTDAFKNTLEDLTMSIFCHHNGTYTQVKDARGVLVCCKCRKPVKSL